MRAMKLSLMLRLGSRFLSLTALAVMMYASFPVSGAMAQDSQGQTSAQQAQEEEEPDAATLAYQRTMGALAQNLSKDDLMHFSVLNTEYYMVSTVKLWMKEVNHAIDGCEKNNPSMKSDMEERRDELAKAMEKPLSDAEKNLSNMMLAQTYAKPEDVKAMLAQGDDLREKKSSIFKTMPVTTPEACKYILVKTKEVQDNMIGLLNMSTKLYSKALQNAQ